MSRSPTSQLSIGIVSGGITRYHGMDCTMVSFGDESTYGRVLEYDEQLDKTDQNSPTGSDLEFTLRESMSFGDGLVVLEAQAKLARNQPAYELQRVLHWGWSVAVGRLHKNIQKNGVFSVEQEQNDAASQKFQTPAPPFGGAREVPACLRQRTTPNSSARLNALQPYGPPPVFSIDNIHAMIEAQYQLAIQHLADLRSEPIYFADVENTT
ncbi:hypothetical protein R3P38DRAFT_2776378 [Favolaschia claudopus]|uniref:Uncharacterized protein n=1 Tax=Favolaschia claudopus TaxID=2862362 RepID=A0AAW0BRD2_9AGAR